tara:strand:- start:44 stop:325 length:282 start_codon:yes stop_codon:yes gene_type:complete
MTRTYLVDSKLMKLQTKKDLESEIRTIDPSNTKERKFSKDYVDFLNEAGWRLEKKLPSNSTYYSDLLEDTDWKNNENVFKGSKHYRRDLDALS